MHQPPTSTNGFPGMAVPRPTHVRTCARATASSPASTSAAVTPPTPAWTILGTESDLAGHDVAVTCTDLHIAFHSGAGAQPGVLRPADAFKEGQEAAVRQQLFGRIAPVYDQLNDTLSLGQHRIWKRMTVKWSGAQPGQEVLDVCCGSGDLAFRLAEAVGPRGKVTGLDFAAEMLQDAEQRQAAAAPKQAAARVGWVQGDALALPFEDGSFDAATMGYGLRNVADIPKALAELRRVLRPGAAAAVLDFNNSTDLVVDAFQEWALGSVVVPLAQWYGVGDEYAYLRPSIKRFPTGQEQARLARAAGFASAVHYEIGFGLMGVLVARKGPAP